MNSVSDEFDDEDEDEGDEFDEWHQKTCTCCKDGYARGYADGKIYGLKQAGYSTNKAGEDIE